MGQPINVPPLAGIDIATAAGKWMLVFRQLLNQLGQAWGSSIQAPSTGFTLTIPQATGVFLLTPGGALATGTVILPGQASDGFQQHILSSQPVAALTVAPNTGQTIVGSASFALSAGVEVVYFFVASTSTWYKMR